VSKSARKLLSLPPDAIIGLVNIELDVRERGKIVQRERTHNIVTNIGRQMLAEVIVSDVAAPTITRHQDTVIRYIGFGIGGNRQNSSIANSAPFSVDYPGSNTQTDTDLTVTGLQRPVQVAAGLWVREIAAPATFPTATSVRFTAVFSETDINFGSYASVPLSEIGLFTSAADPSLPNGAAGAYPGAGGLMTAYDTFNTIHKSGVFSIEVRWEYRF
jgi:hypothetical protein